MYIDVLYFKVCGLIYGKCNSRINYCLLLFIYLTHYTCKNNLNKCQQGKGSNDREWSWGGELVRAVDLGAFLSVTCFGVCVLFIGSHLAPSIFTLPVPLGFMIKNFLNLLNIPGSFISLYCHCYLSSNSYLILSSTIYWNTYIVFFWKYGFWMFKFTYSFYGL